MDRLSSVQTARHVAWTKTSTQRWRLLIDLNRDSIYLNNKFTSSTEIGWDNNGRTDWVKCDIVTVNPHTQKCYGSKWNYSFYRVSLQTLPVSYHFYRGNRGSDFVYVLLLCPLMTATLLESRTTENNRGFFSRWKGLKMTGGNNVQRI